MSSFLCETALGAGVSEGDEGQEGLYVVFEELWSVFGWERCMC